MANDSDDLDRVGNTIEELIESGRLSRPDAESMVRDLANNQNFYGNYCELRVYSWLHCQGARFSTQIQLTGTDVLNPNGCVIDGLFDYSQVYFDIKAFGFLEYVVENFRTALENNLPGMMVTIDGSMDVSVKDIERHAFPQVSALAEKLQEDCHQKISQLNWEIRANPRQLGSTSFQETVIDPFRLAEENRHYPFKSARQFTRNAPFLLISPMLLRLANRWASILSEAPKSHFGRWQDEHSCSLPKTKHLPTDLMVKLNPMLASRKLLSFFLDSYSLISTKGTTGGYISTHVRQIPSPKTR